MQNFQKSKLEFFFNYYLEILHKKKQFFFNFDIQLPFVNEKYLFENENFLYESGQIN